MVVAKAKVTKLVLVLDEIPRLVNRSDLLSLIACSLVSSILYEYIIGLPA